MQSPHEFQSRLRGAWHRFVPDEVAAHAARHLHFTCVSERTNNRQAEECSRIFPFSHHLRRPSESSWSCKCSTQKRETLHPADYASSTPAKMRALRVYRVNSFCRCLRLRRVFAT